jgi:hypothetical protein
MKAVALIFSLVVSGGSVFAFIYNHPVSFAISTDKESYYEGEKITILITITNTSQENSYPVLLPHLQNTGPKLFSVNIYDKANNTLLLRYTENRMLDMMVHDLGSVEISYLKPQEQIVVPIYLNDFENYYSQTSSNHSLGVPLFAGVYKMNITYNPKGIALGDSIYYYTSDMDKGIPSTNKLLINEQGLASPMIDLKIKRSSDTLISINGINYYIKTDGYMYYYFSEYVDKIITDLRCIHITTLPPDSCSLPTGEYFYSHFTNLYAEYISRFDDGDIREYRRFIDYCPDYLYTEQYNAFKQKILYACQLPDGRFYKVSYDQPSGNVLLESYCSASGTHCTEILYVYNGKGEFLKKKVTETQPCVEVEIEGRKVSVHSATNL